MRDLLFVGVSLGPFWLPLRISFPEKREKWRASSYFVSALVFTLKDMGQLAGGIQQFVGVPPSPKMS